MTRREQLQHLGYLMARRDATTHAATWKRLECRRLATLDQLEYMSDAEWDDVFESAADWELRQGLITSPLFLARRVADWNASEDSFA